MKYFSLVVLSLLSNMPLAVADSHILTTLIARAELSIQAPNSTEESISRVFYNQLIFKEGTTCSEFEESGIVEIGDSLIGPFREIGRLVPAYWTDLSVKECEGCL